MSLPVSPDGGPELQRAGDVQEKKKRRLQRGDRGRGAIWENPQMHRGESALSFSFYFLKCVWLVFSVRPTFICWFPYIPALQIALGCRVSKCCWSLLRSAQFTHMTFHYHILMKKPYKTRAKGKFFLLDVFGVMLVNHFWVNLDCITNIFFFPPTHLDGLGTEKPCAFCWWARASWQKTLPESHHGRG